MNFDKKCELKDQLINFSEFLLARSADRAYANHHRSKCAEYIKRISDVIQIIEEF